MGLKYVDNFTWSTNSNLPATLTTTYGGTTIAASRLTLDGIGSGCVLSNNLTSQATYVINVQVNFGRLGNEGSAGMPPLNVTPILTLCEGGSLAPNVQTGLGLRSDGKLQFYRGATLIGAVSPQALVADNLVTFYDIEYKIVVGAAGSIEARVNGGVQIGPTTPINTQNTLNAFADSVVIANTNQGASNCQPTERYQHIIAMDGTGANLNGGFIGPVDVVLLPPTGDGFYTEWSVTGAATRWQAVQTNDGDTSYISDNTVGHRNLFIQPGLPAGSTAVVATGVWAVAREDDAVTRAFKILLRKGVTDNLGPTEFFVGPNYLYFFQPYEVSPFTGVQWTVAEVNTPVQYGAQVTT